MATAYLDYLYTKEGRKIIAQSYYRPIDEEVAEAYKDSFRV
ncbi:hypothetical protein [Cellulosilyticum ruminicola]|nr:hypothetical protein [Cellulosilyticum ruminicola]